MVKTDRLFTVFSLRRSGHHAILMWLIEQLGEPWIHVNDFPIHKFEKKQTIPWKKRRINSVLYKSGSWETIPPLRSMAMNFEEVVPEISERYSFLNFMRFNRQDYIIVVRHPLNHLASCWKIFHDKEKMTPNKNSKPYVFLETNDPKSFWDRWKIYACAYERWANESNIHVILFDKWHIDKTYRQEICQKMNIPFTDVNKNKLAYSGSSFGTELDNVGVVNRWSYFSNNPDFWEFANYDEEVKELSIRLFGKWVD